MSFRAIRERDRRGNLVAAGYEWAEHKDMPGIALYLLTCMESASPGPVSCAAARALPACR